jgi:4-hydroxy-2-oxoheptanedioate aldolase
MSDIVVHGSSLRDRMSRHELIIGALISNPNPRSVDIIASLGFDYIFLDNEHELTDPSELRECIRSSAVHRVPAIVRVSGPSRSEIGKSLDSGAAGIVIPRVEDADVLARVISFSRYAPIGERGFGPTVPWLRYFQGQDPANWNPGIIAIVESVRGVNAINELAAVPGVDAIFPGPGDLSQELGDPTMNSPKLLQLMAQINEAVLSVESGPALMAYAGAGVPFVTGGPDAGRAIAAGASVILVGPDTALLRQACTAAISAVIVEYKHHRPTRQSDAHSATRN